jgi:FtsH-binding integral membrane protein
MSSVLTTTSVPFPSARAARRGYAAGFVALLVLLAAVFVPHLAAGHVVHAHDWAAEAGVDQGAKGFTTRNTDPWHLFVPEMHMHVACERGSWLPTWNPHNELGRPVFPLGLGRAYVVGHALSWVAGDGFQMYTWTCLAAVLGTAVFAFLFLRQLGLLPSACFVGAAGLSVGPLCIVWPVNPLLQWGFCWTFAALFVAERWLARPTVWSWIGLVFCVHSILLTGYVVHVVLLGWIVAGWLVLRTCDLRASWGGRLAALGALLGAALVGAATVVPAYLDLYVTWRESARYDFPAQTKALQPGEPLWFWVRFYDAFLLEQPRRAPDPEGNPNLSTAYAALVAVALLGWRERRAWYWIGWGALALAMTTSERLVPVQRALGLVFSNWPTYFAAVLPLAVVAALGADRLLRAEGVDRWRNAAVAAVALAGVAVALYFVEQPFHVRRGLFALALGAGVVVAALAPRRLFLLALVSAAALFQATLVIPWQPRSGIHMDSPLAAEVRSRTSDGSRFAWLGPPPNDRFLASNVEIVLGLASIHTYDHFASRGFDAWARTLRSVPPRNEYQRHFSTIAPDAPVDLALPALHGVSTILSTADRADFGAEVARHGAVRVYEPFVPSPLQSLLPAGAYRLDAPGHATVEPDAVLSGLPVERLETDAHDVQRFAFAPAASESLLFVSQQHDPRWRARTIGGELPLRRVNGFLQGVVVPPGTFEVELSFEPWVRWQLAPQALFLAAAATFALARLLARRRAEPAVHSPPTSVRIS